MIKSFKCKETELVFCREISKRFRFIQEISLRKLLQIHAAEKLEDLMIPPGNRLEVLKGDRKKQYSIRINKQWRICFKWQENNAYEVEIVDYH